MDTTAVFNLAIGYFNEEPRDDWDNVDKLARLCEMYLPRAEDAVRREYAWSFLTDIMPVLTNLGTKTMNGVEYSESYALPSWVDSVESVKPSTEYIFDNGTLYAKNHVDEIGCNAVDGLKTLYTFKDSGQKVGYAHSYRLPSEVGRVIKVNNGGKPYKVLSSNILSNGVVDSILYIGKHATSDNYTYESMVALKLAQILLAPMGGDRNIASLIYSEYAKLKEELIRNEIYTRREVNDV